jgi:hypothetical protein
VHGLSSGPLIPPTMPGSHVVLLGWDGSLRSGGIDTGLEVHHFADGLPGH